MDKGMESSVLDNAIASLLRAKIQNPVSISFPFDTSFFNCCVTACSAVSSHLAISNF
ncbi:hypothetical protein EC82524_2797, partial [Escherichia coli 8.2524]